VEAVLMKPSNLIATLQHAKTALEKDGTTNSALYEEISTEIYRLETLEKLPNDWRDNQNIKHAKVKGFYMVYFEDMDKAINRWVEKNEVEMTDIKYQIGREDGDTGHYVLISYFQKEVQ
jgi:hypothetical protein